MGLQKRIENLEKANIASGKGYLIFYHNYDEDSKDVEPKDAEERALKDYMESGGKLECIEFTVAFRDYSGNADTQPSFKFVPIVC